ncbi:MAG: helix-turn-helix transcriptional regulator [Clostridiales bacterium]|nr:helix-turn-helix transcriptional regulator [Clostridiales bacterium]
MMFDDPYEHAFHAFGGKWKPRIIYGMHINETIRFSSVRKNLPISEKVLSKIFKELETDGIVTRTVYPEVPVRVEYRLTPHGRSIIPILEAIYKWSRERMLETGMPIDQEGERNHGYLA